jgi:hypothetical protein
MTENPCKQSVFYIAGRIIKTNVIAYVSIHAFRRDKLCLLWFIIFNFMTLKFAIY